MTTDYHLGKTPTSQGREIGGFSGLDSLSCEIYVLFLSLHLFKAFTTTKIDNRYLLFLTALLGQNQKDLIKNYSVTRPGNYSNLMEKCF